MKEREPLIICRRRSRARPKLTPNHRPVPEDVAIGTAVLYRSHPSAEPVTTRTRSKTWRLAHGAPVVLVEGRPGGVALLALELADDQLELFTKGRRS